MMSSSNSHPFYNITISQNPKLLESIITFVATYPTPNMMTVATGITPHRKIIKDLNCFVTKLHYLSSKVENIYAYLKRVLLDEIEEKTE